ncbi:hypothetical protein CCM_02407 [Cordyceps militaris CM01]|uniref:PD-(D/E)XK nuclease-like domain-containing protein n=1 Tax=Cordyceps militaris (strain CM01) TaxID=983644 RepID=G3J9L0_CORMM|nr:uncharacterized protein CCM_02407 [Cordyceps militaris CM01]EGX94136.1 hypothetical protein CCM_02407 [Cordyceps militaris CM01]
MSTGESTVHNAVHTPALSEERGPGSTGNAPAPVGAYQAYLDRKRKAREDDELIKLDIAGGRCPTSITWEQHRANLAVKHQALLDAHALAASNSQAEPPQQTGRIASPLPPQANPDAAASRAQSTRAAEPRRPQKESLAHKWLSRLRPPVLRQEHTLEKGHRAAAQAALAADVTAELGQEGPLPSSFFYPGPFVNGQAFQQRNEREQRGKELGTLMKLVDAAARCGAHDAEWNEKVRRPLIEHVVGTAPGEQTLRCQYGDVDVLLAYDSVTEELLREKPGAVDGRRMSFTIDICDKVRLSGSIARKLDVPGRPDPFVNHVSGDVDEFDELVGNNDPIGAFIATRAPSSAVAADVDLWGLDLGVHAAALHNRLSSFLDAKYGTDPGAWYGGTCGAWWPSRGVEGIPEPHRRPLIPVLPLVYVAGHDWYLYFGCDRGKEIVLLDGVPMGSTRTLLSIYRLVKVLTDICRYIDEHYKPWLMTLFDCSWPNNPWEAERKK